MAELSQQRASKNRPFRYALLPRFPKPQHLQLLFFSVIRFVQSLIKANCQKEYVSMGNKKQVFVSYCHADEGALQELLPLLKKYSFVFWHDEDIVGGQKWKHTIEGEIKKSEALLFLLSHKSKKSVECQNEINKAIELKKLIVPVSINVKPQQYPDYLSQIQIINATKGLNEGIAVRVINALIEYGNEKRAVLETRLYLLEGETPDDEAFVRLKIEVVNVEGYGAELNQLE
ncbi:MAG: toll/interleukin-1 receptor domain-containing protein [bacterium]|nr:toll/interleukin-1 receptor domain-containing protein [bacterium]